MKAFGQLKKMIIKVDNLLGDEVIKLLQEHHQDMRLHSPPESIHALDVLSLKASEITFWSAWKNHELAACGALKQLSNGHAEIKSMRTSLNFRRQGVAQKLLEFIINQAKKRGYKQISLETGSMDAFKPARNLYKSFGFRYCEPFADYSKDINSVFMSKNIQ